MHGKQTVSTDVGQGLEGMTQEREKILVRTTEETDGSVTYKVKL